MVPERRRKWQIFQKYIKTLKDENDTTIIYQVIWLLKKTLELGTSVPIEVGDIIFSIEDILHRIYRFLRNDELLEFERLCKQYFLKSSLYLDMNNIHLTNIIQISNKKSVIARVICLFTLVVYEFLGLS